MLANCALAGTSATEARGLTLYEYDALVTGWERANAEEDIEPPTADEWRAEMERLRNSPAATNPGRGPAPTA